MMGLIFVLCTVLLVSAAVSAGTLFVPPDVINGTVGVTGTCGGNCPSNTCNNCPCGSTIRTEDIATWCSKHSWNQRNCQCIMQNESGGYANAACKDADGSYDAGLWQINSSNWGECNNGNAPCDPKQNLACAKMIYGWAGNTWKYWATCGKCGCCNSA